MSKKRENKKAYLIQEAENLISDILQYYIDKPFSELEKLIDKELITGEIHIDKNSYYYYEIQVMLDNKLSDCICVTGIIDGNGITPDKPVIVKYILDKNNNIIQE